MYIAPEKLLLPQDHELEYNRAIDKTVNFITNVLLMSVGFFPWLFVANLM